MRKFLALAVFLFSTGAFAQGGDTKVKWDALVAAAKQEGKVVVIGPPAPTPALAR